MSRFTRQKLNKQAPLILMLLGFGPLSRADILHKSERLAHHFGMGILWTRHRRDRHLENILDHRIEELAKSGLVEVDENGLFHLTGKGHPAGDHLVENRPERE